MQKQFQSSPSLLLPPLLLPVAAPTPSSGETFTQGGTPYSVYVVFVFLLAEHAQNTQIWLVPWHAHFTLHPWLCDYACLLIASQGLKFLVHSFVAYHIPCMYETYDHTTFLLSEAFLSNPLSMSIINFAESYNIVMMRCTTVYAALTRLTMPCLSLVVL